MRYIDWQDRLLKIAIERENTPFQWGSYDCCLYVADTIEAMTGFDPAEWFRGKYDSEEGAMALIEEKGGMVGYMDSLFKSKSVEYAQRGDAVVVETDNGPTMGIMWSGGAVWMQSETGVKLFPRLKKRITHVWGI